MIAPGSPTTNSPRQRLLVDMAQRNVGRVLITFSIASTMPGAFQARYNASKAFLQSFAVGLQDELKDTNIRTTRQSRCPGLRRADGGPKQGRRVLAFDQRDAAPEFGAT